LTDQLPDRSSKGDGPKASQIDHFMHSNIVTLYLQLRCNACGVVSLELEEAISEARCARRNRILVLFFVMPHRRKKIGWLPLDEAAMEEVPISNASTKP
jgi:hypothetical protein